MNSKALFHRRAFLYTASQYTIHIIIIIIIMFNSLLMVDKRQPVETLK